MTVNQLVVGWIPTAGATKIDTLADTARCFFIPTFSHGRAVAVIIDIYRLFFIFHGDTETAYSYAEFKRRRALSGLFSHILNQIAVMKQLHAICKGLYSRKISSLL